MAAPQVPATSGNYCTVGIISDLHYACAAEQARGDGYEMRHLRNPFVRVLLKLYRRYVWLQQPLRKNYLVDRFLATAGRLDLVVANGDFTCDSGFVGVSDAAACESVRECLSRLRQAFGPGFHAVYGDHELGKLTMVGRCGGMRLRSFQVAHEELGLEPFWTRTLGNYVLMGVTSSLIALPVLEADMLPEERPAWERLREQHLEAIGSAFAGLKSEQKVLLFCHDPTALPFLAQLEPVRKCLPQVEQTIIGHLHSSLFLWKCRLLSGMPRISWLGHSVKKFSTALNRAREWKPFRVRLCPSLAGIELLKDGGWYTVVLRLDGTEPARFEFHRLRR